MGFHSPKTNTMNFCQFLDGDWGTFLIMLKLSFFLHKQIYSSWGLWVLSNNLPYSIKLTNLNLSICDYVAMVSWRVEDLMIYRFKTWRSFTQKEDRTGKRVKGETHPVGAHTHTQTDRQKSLTHELSPISLLYLVEAIFMFIFLRRGSSVTSSSEIRP